MRRLRERLVQVGGALALVLALVFAAGCGGGDHPGGLASLVPPDAPLYAEAVVRPDEEQADAIESLADRVGGISDPGAEAIATLERSFADDGLAFSYESDIEPWLGDHAAIFVRSFESAGIAGGADAAVLAEVTDPDEARDVIEKAADADPRPEEQRSYRGTDYLYSDRSGGLAMGTIEDRALAVGTQAAFKVAVDASQGESLGESEEYIDRVDPLADDPLGKVFIEPGTVLEAALASEHVARMERLAIESLVAGPFSQPIAFELSATPNTATVDMAAMLDPKARVATGSPLLDGLPGESWFAAAVPDLGPTLVRTLDRVSNSGAPGARRIEREIRARTGLDLSHDVIGWLGDAAVFVEGAGVPGLTAGLIAQTSDPRAPRPLLDAVRRAVERDSGLRSVGPPEGADYGFSVGLPGLGGGAEAGVVDEMLVAVIGTTAELALHPDRTLADEQRFRTAISALGDVAPVFYVHLPSLSEAARRGVDGAAPDYDALAPYLDAFESLAGGARVDDGLLLSRGTVTLAPE